MVNKTVEKPVLQSGEHVRLVGKIKSNVPRKTAQLRLSKISDVFSAKNCFVRENGQMYAVGSYEQLKGMEQAIKLLQTFDLL